MRIARRPLADEIYKRLLDEIMDGRLPAGSRLCEERLCERLGVSRTPLREAMIRLVREGALEKRHNYGCVVRKQDIAALEELMQARSLMECLALREWFGSLDAAALKAVEGRLRAAESGPEESLREGVLAADEEMHGLILKACGNGLIAEQIRSLQALCRPYRVHRLEGSSSVKEMLLERRRVLDAMLAGDVEGAASALAAHFECSLKHYRASFAPKGT